MIEIPKEKQVLAGYRFIDLFAGIGGFHYALSSFGAECVFASEVDKHAAQVYYNNHGLKPQGDITKIVAADIPDHDILCGGFPCQAFSISGKQRGFEDTRGTLFFDIARITQHHRPKILFLENVKNFVRHDDGNTLATVMATLQELGYHVFYQILNTSRFGLPQNRERVYIVAFLTSHFESVSFSFPEGKIDSHLTEILEDSPQAKIIERDDIFFHKNFKLSYDKKGTPQWPNRPIQIGRVNKGGQGERIYHPQGHAVTLSAYGGGVGAKTGLYHINGQVRKLSPRECARLQGFPEHFKPDEKPNQAYKQFGNSVSVNVLQYILEMMNIPK